MKKKNRKLSPLEWERLKMRARAARERLGKAESILDPSTIARASGRGFPEARDPDSDRARWESKRSIYRQARSADIDPESFEVSPPEAAEPEGYRVRTELAEYESRLWRTVRTIGETFRDSLGFVLLLIFAIALVIVAAIQAGAI